MGGLCLAQDTNENLEPAPNAHGQINYGQPRRDTTESLFGTNGVLNRPSNPSEPQTKTSVSYGKQVPQTQTSVQSYSKPEPTPKRKTAHHSKHSKAAETAQTEQPAEPPKPVKHILLVPVDRDNGHGMPVTVYDKYHYYTN